jgi:hypothetical protein
MSWVILTLAAEVRYFWQSDVIGSFRLKIWLGEVIFDRVINPPLKRVIVNLKMFVSLEICDANLSCVNILFHCDVTNMLQCNPKIWNR